MQDAMLLDLNRMTTDQDAAVKVMLQYGGKTQSSTSCVPLVAAANAYPNQVYYREELGDNCRWF